MLGRLYDEAAWRHRRWYDRRPELRRRLARPVVSVGALAAGGSGKTPMVAALARMLVEMGERPAILSRGYGRADPVEGAAVIRDFGGTVGSPAVAGDEPWMLAAALDGVAVVVAEDRHLAGRLAETHLGATVHLLDDGFQHLPLERGTDLVLLSAADLDDRVLPAGRLRERLATAARADALLLVDVAADRRALVGAAVGGLRGGRPPLVDAPADGRALVGGPVGGLHGDPLSLVAAQVARRTLLGAVVGNLHGDRPPLVDAPADGRTGGRSAPPPPRVFDVRRRAGAVWVRGPRGEGDGLDPGTRLAAVAGIARPGRFFDDLRAAGFDVVRAMAFPDHHRYSRRDVRRVQAEARRAGAQAIVTTEKDFVRLDPWLPFDPVLATMPLTCAVTPEAPFRAFIAERLAAGRSEAR